MAAANKLAVLQKIKWEKGVLLTSFLNDLTKLTKCEKGKEVTELSESLELAVAVLLRHSVAGVDPDFGGLKLIQFLVPTLRKRIQNYEC
jgi:hypothetical protein